MNRKPKEPTDKEILFMQIIGNLSRQYMELTEEETIDFVCDVMDMLDKYDVRIK